MAWIRQEAMKIWEEISQEENINDENFPHFMNPGQGSVNSKSNDKNFFFVDFALPDKEVALKIVEKISRVLENHSAIARVEHANVSLQKDFNKVFVQTK